MTFARDGFDRQRRLEAIRRAERKILNGVIYMLIAVLSIVLILLLSWGPAHAADCRYDNDGKVHCFGVTLTPKAGPHRARAQRPPARPARAVAVNDDRAGLILSHPPGCPRRAFCGCGASVRVFGRPIRALYLAANWRKFPAATPRAGMVAWRHHHVMVIERMTGPQTALVYDANSGQHLTRLHERSLRGYRIVNPFGGVYAQGMS
jgi:hypothetical protein